METITVTPRVDARGKTISTYVVFEVATALQNMDEGAVLELLTDDYEPIDRDLTAWGSATGHRLLSSESIPSGRLFAIRKGPPKARGSSLAMVISTDGLEELLSPLGFALAAALDGMDVHLYFQGPGVRVLSRGFHPKLRGWGRPFSRFAAAGMNKTGHIPAVRKLDQLRSLGAKIYVCGASMPHFKVKKEDLIYDDVPLVAYFTFIAVMEHADVSLYM
ncbi:MAG: DsrE family protein [Acidimicrobiia bacterium]|nr:DsrE family protein [Acidimicrobiia bacterium]